MSYKTTLKWYADNDPFDYESILKLVSAQQSLGVVGPVAPPKPDVIPSGVLEGKNVCLVVGHEPGGGAPNERKWNLALAGEMAEDLEALGAEVFVYTHRTRDYPQRCREMRAGVQKHMPDADCVVLLHYNDVDYPEAHGHEFHYYGTRAIAEAFRDQWQKDHPWSRARQDNGVLKNRNGNGSRMMKMAPAACVLVESFFYSNPEENSKFYEKPEVVQSTFVKAITQFLIMRQP